MAFKRHWCFALFGRSGLGDAVPAVMRRIDLGV
jgi:hypothetical protein